MPINAASSAAATGTIMTVVTFFGTQYFDGQKYAADAAVRTAKIEAASAEQLNRTNAIQTLLSSREAAHERTLQSVQQQYRSSLDVLAKACK